MEHHLDMDLSRLRQHLLTMARHVETAVARSVQSLLQRDYDLAQQIREGDRMMDQFGLEVDHQAMGLLTRSPLAEELRLVMVAMKLGQHLERTGHEAGKIARLAADLCQEPELPSLMDLRRLAGPVMEMLKGALDAFSLRDAAAARLVILRDLEVGEVVQEFHTGLTRRMVEQPADISRCLHWLGIAKSLEQVAEHAVALAEYAIFYCEAADIRTIGRDLAAA